MYKAKAFGFTLFLIFVFCFSINSKGQTIDYGVKAGFNISNHTAKYTLAGNTLTPQPAFGFELGSIIRTQLNDSLRLAFEPSLIKLGANYNESITVQEQDYEILSGTHLFYLHLPILLQLHKKLGGKLGNTSGDQFGDYSYHISAGLYGEYLLDAQYRGRAIENGTLSRPSSNDVKINYSKYDAGLMAGFGIELIEKIIFETRFQYTLIQAYKFERKYKPKNYALKLSIGFMLN